VISNLLLTIAVIGFLDKASKVKYEKRRRKENRMMNKTCKETKELCCCLDERTLILMADSTRTEIRKLLLEITYFPQIENFAW